MVFQKARSPLKMKSHDHESDSLIQINCNASSEVKLVYDNGATYDGQTLHGKRHGRGTFVNSSAGFTYMGDFRDDFAHGMGEASYLIADEESAAGGGQIESRYNGEWALGLRSGYGELSTSVGDRFEGNWDSDQPCMGCWTFPDGSWFEGQYESGVRSKGVFSSADGRETYKGDFKGPDREGEGLLQIEGVFEYKGGFEGNKRHGQGECRYSRGGADSRDAGGCYAGSWAGDQRSGIGEMKWPSGEIYAGSWADDQRQGQGTCTFANGDHYVGYWAKDLPHGRGRMISNGEKYEGEFELGKRQGYGRALFRDGSTFAGRWEEDCWIQTAADPRRSLVQLSQKTIAREVSQFKILARDSSGHPRITGGDYFIVKISPVVDIALGISSEDPDDQQGVIEGSVEDFGDGSYVCRYPAPQLSGIYRISIKAPPVFPKMFEEEKEGDMPDLIHCGDSPYLLRVVPSTPDHKKLRLMVSSCSIDETPDSRDQVVSMASCSISQGSNGMRCIAGSTVSSRSLSIEVRDRFDNLIKGAKALSSLHMIGRIVGGSNGQHVTYLSFIPQTSKGCISVEFVAPALAGLYRMEIEMERDSALNGGVLFGFGSSKHIPGSPFSLSVCNNSSQVPEYHEEGRRQIEVEDWDKRVEEAMKGWEADDEGGKPMRDQHDKEDEDSRLNPHVPIVDKLENLWMLGSLQALKKKRDRK